MIMAYPGLFDGLKADTLPEAFRLKAHIFYAERLIECALAHGRLADPRSIPDGVPKASNLV